MSWRDTSERQPGEWHAEPNRLSIEGNALRLTVHKLSRDGSWWMQGHGMDFSFPLKAKSASEAKLEAIGLAQERLERMMADLNDMKSA